MANRSPYDICHPEGKPPIVRSPKACSIDDETTPTTTNIIGFVDYGHCVTRLILVFSSIIPNNMNSDENIFSRF